MLIFENNSILFLLQVSEHKATKTTPEAWESDLLEIEIKMEKGLTLEEKSLQRLEPISVNINRLPAGTERIRFVIRQ